MDEKLSKIIGGLKDFGEVARFEANAKKQGKLDTEVATALKAKSGQLGRELIARRTGLDLSELSPAEEKIVQAAAEYAGIKKRQGRNTERMFGQLVRKGLLDSAETSVMKSKPTPGFRALADENLLELSYEQIVVDHPEEFSPRALWYARRTLNLPNATPSPPSRATTPIQTRTEELLRWLGEMSGKNGGRFPVYTNATAAAAIGLGDMHSFGRAYGNVVSRMDFACYKAKLPPLGLTADKPFAKAWGRRDRDWAYPISDMQDAAKKRIWSEKDFALILKISETLPGQAYLIWQAEPEGAVRKWAFDLHSDAQTDNNDDSEAETSGQRNKPWSREELILVLDLYLRSRSSPYPKDSMEVAVVSKLLNELGSRQTGTVGEKYRNANGVYMKMMNFRRFDPEYTADGKVGLTRGNKLEEVVWKEYSKDPQQLALAVASITKGHEAPASSEQPYWVFVCNPKRWAVDRFFDRNIEIDSWGIRPADKDSFAPGQLGIVRVGVDKRNLAERNGRPPLEPGIYAVCEVISEVYSGTGANDEFWGEGVGRAPGWPTVDIRYLHVYRDKPLTIEDLRKEKPDLSPLLLNGFQAASFPISGDDFRVVTSLLDFDLDDMPPITKEVGAGIKDLSNLEKQFLKASPEVKERVSRTVERGPVGRAVKKALGFKCQLCDVIGAHPLGFVKKNGEHYVEAHHVMPVALLQIGSLAVSNIMILCANHHRQVHYGNAKVVIAETTFDVTLDGAEYRIARPAVSVS